MAHSVRLRVRVHSLAPMLWLTCLIGLHAQQPPPATAPPTVPRVFWLSGEIRGADGQPATGPIQLQFAIYKEAEGGVPLVTELQTVQLNAQGRYGVLLGSTLPDGLPLDVFSTTDARWIGVQPAGGPERPRMAIISVPYALKAADAETLAGKPASAYLLADPTARATTEPAAADGSKPARQTTSPQTTSSPTAGTPGYLGVFTDSSNLGNSTLFQS